MSFYWKIGLNTFYQLIGRSLTTFANFIIILLIASSLGGFGLGQYNKVIAFVGIFSLLVDFGLNAVFLKVGTIHELSLLVILRLIIASIVFILIQPIIFILPYNKIIGSGFSFQEKIYIEIISLVLFLFAFSHSLNAIFQKYQRFDLTIFPNLVWAIISLSFGIYSFYTRKLFLFFLAMVFGLVGYVVTALVLIRRFLNVETTRRVVSTDILFIKKMFKKSLPLAASLFLNLIYVRADVFILSILKPTIEVGIYTLAYKFFDFPLNLSFFIMGALYPVFLKSKKEDKKIFYQQIKKSGLIIFIFSFFIFLFSFIGAPLIGLIKQEFYQSILPFRILSFSYPIFFLSNLFLWVIITEGKEKILPFIYGASLILNVVLNLIFIPQFGYNASAVITVFSELFVLTFFTFFLKILKNDIKTKDGIPIFLKKQKSP
jgi:O-antigen/teichoic acid export membrane protein